MDNGLNLGFSSNNIPNNLPYDKLESITQINLPNYSPKGTRERDRRSGRLVESVKSVGSIFGFTDSKIDLHISCMEMKTKLFSYNY